MRVTAYLALLTALTFPALSQNVVDSLYQILDSTSIDTTRISLLVDISGEYELDEEKGLDAAILAYQLAQSVNSEAHKAKSEANLALFYFAVNQDSALALSQKSIQRYRSLGMFKKVADSYWNMALSLEQDNQYDSAISYLQRSLAISEAHKYVRGIGDAHYSLSVINSIRGKNKEALEHAFKAKTNYEKIGNQLYLGEALNQIGIIYDYLGMYPEAIEHYLQAKEIAVETKAVDDEILVLNNLGVIYDNMKNPELAANYYAEALEKSNIYNRKEDQATLLNNLSYIYLNQKDTARALNALWQSLTINETVQILCFDIYPMEGLGSIYVAQENLDSAKHYLSITLDKANQCEDVGILAVTHKGLGQVYAKEGQKKRALYHLNESLRLSDEAQLVVEQKSSILALFQFHKDQGNTSIALRYLEHYQKFTDSIYDQQSIEKATQLAAEYDFRTQMDSLKANQIASELRLTEEIKVREKINNYILLALVLAAGLAGTMARFYYVLQKRNKKLKWLNEEKNTLMGVVAHDLRSPLNSIKGLLQLLEETGVRRKNQDEKEYLKLIGLSTNKMRGMIDRVLDISAIENMKVNLNLVKADLTKLLAVASENFANVATQKDIAIHNEFDLNQEFCANIDPNYFDQIMDNLISNAIKFSDEGKSIYLNLQAQEDSYLLSVRDEGPGIGKEDQKNLFQKFTTLATKPTSQEQSTGLGLSIAMKFVTAMNGKLFCESEKGQGATFFLQFEKA